MRNRFGNLLGPKLLTHMRFVAFPGAAFPAAFTSFWGRGNFRDIRRRRLGGILRIDSQQSLYLFYLRFQNRYAFSKPGIFFFQMLYICIFVIFIHVRIIGRKMLFCEINLTLVERLPLKKYVPYRNRRTRQK